MPEEVADQRSLLEAVLGDGRPLLLFTGLALVLSGAFALFQSATGEFLPQDVAYLQMTARRNKNSFIIKRKYLNAGF